MKNKRGLIISIFLILTIFSLILLDKKQENSVVVEAFKNEYSQGRRFVYPMGSIVGIKADTDGALVIGLEDDKVEYVGGLKIGDNIISIEDQKITNSQDITKILNDLCQDEVKIVYERDNKLRESRIKTKFQNNKYKLGLWVRDKISGIGTLTCYDPISNEFYAIGHGICDMDTDKLLSIKEGNIYKTSNINISKKDNNTVGQLKGLIDYNASLGTFYINTNNGIKGNFSNYNYSLNLPLVEIGRKEDVKLGNAYILFQSKNGSIKSYKIKIEKIIKEENNMLIKVVDKELIDYTGGIVKGMSGAPIIQNNKLIGSLTYVFKHNSKKGYGIFIDEMLKL